MVRASDQHHVGLIINPHQHVGTKSMNRMLPCVRSQSTNCKAEIISNRRRTWRMTGRMKQQLELQL